MSIAVEEPKKKRKTKELHTEDVLVRQPERLVQPPLGSQVEPEATVIETVPDKALGKGNQGLGKDWYDEIALNEEPITIYVEPAVSETDAKFVEAWVNGKGIEIYLNGKWIETKGIPRGHRVTIRKKYVEALMLSMVEKVTTEVVMPEHPGEDVQNCVDRKVRRNIPLSVFPGNERDRRWYQRLVSRYAA